MCKIFQWKTLQSLWLNTFYLTKYKLSLVRSWCCTKELFETRISFKSFNIWTKCGAKMNWKYIPQNWSFHWNRALITFVVEVTIKVFRLCSGLIGSGIDWKVFEKTFPWWCNIIHSMNFLCKQRWDQWGFGINNASPDVCIGLYVFSFLEGRCTNTNALQWWNETLWYTGMSIYILVWQRPWCSG